MQLCLTNHGAGDQGVRGTKCILLYELNVEGFGLLLTVSCRRNPKQSSCQTGTGGHFQLVTYVLLPTLQCQLLRRKPPSVGSHPRPSSTPASISVAVAAEGGRRKCPFPPARSAASVALISDPAPVRQAEGRTSCMTRPTDASRRARVGGNVGKCNIFTLPADCHST